MDEQTLDMYTREVENDLHTALVVVEKVRDMFFNATVSKDGTKCIVDVAAFNDIASEIAAVLRIEYD